ncbi:MAG: acyloxyacyl hydrolase [Pseudomonadota bacterium]|nr:acyloxyacyl hydrolase [Xanthomonadaceae bacterium]MDE2247263.1 acyloxyacyl hydrolase [Xanthomonadaceae bacterium]MDE3211432.1 acyloxyacyl hydrolase [Pseudomonadota bacterium]
MPIPVPARRILALALFAAALPATAARLELQVGSSYAESHDTDVGFVEAAFAPRPLARTGFSWSPDVSAGWIDGRDLRPDGSRFARYRPQQAVGLVAAGARFHLADPAGRLQPLFFSEQLAATDRVSRALSSHYQFVSTLGWQARHFTFALRHISNGGLHRPNTGETMAVVGLALGT